MKEFEPVCATEFSFGLLLEQNRLIFGEFGLERFSNEFC